MSKDKDPIDDIIEALQALRYHRRLHSSGDEFQESASKVMRMLVYIAEAEHGDGKASHDIRFKVAEAFAEKWNLDIEPRLSADGRLKI